MNKVFITVFAAVLIAAFVGTFAANVAAPTSQSHTFGTAIDGPLYSIDVASTTDITTASKPVVATSTGRRYLSIANNGAASVYCAYDDKPAAFLSGFFITGSSTKEWYGDNLYTGAVRCIAPATTRLMIQEAL